MKKINLKEILSKNSIVVSNVNEAIQIATQLKNKNFFDMFRGQIHDYPLIPSLLRESCDQERALDRRDDLTNRIHDYPELESLHWNKDSIYAIAQHYGIPTPLLDFTKILKLQVSLQVMDISHQRKMQMSL